MTPGDVPPNGDGYNPGYGPEYAAGYNPGYPQTSGLPPAPGWGQLPPWQHQPVVVGTPAGLGRRFWARVIDGMICGAVGSLLSFFVFPEHYPFLVTGLFSGVLIFGYFVLFETNSGATPGKRLFKLRVYGPDGLSTPTAGQSAIRNLFTLLQMVPYLGPLLFFATGVVIAVTIKDSPTKQGKHDELAGGTQVIRQ